MVGKRLLRFIHLRLQEIQGNQLPFGGLNIVLIGDLHQLQPVKDGWIFEDSTDAYSPLATNLFTEHFQFFELTEIMRQKEDKQFAETLNRLRTESHTDDDIALLETRLISYNESATMSSVPHFFATNAEKDAFNTLVLNQSAEKTVIACAVDSAPSDIPRHEQQKALKAAETKQTSAAGNLPHELTLKEGQLYDITANMSVEDGIINGTECHLKQIDAACGDKLPRCVWVKFSDPLVGRECRKSVSVAYRNLTSKLWTPIMPVQRMFLVGKGNIKIFRTQFPLQLASGRTIHKAQSSTHEKIVVDMAGPPRAPKHFWDHMHYVALSRVTSLHGLHIVNINREAIRSSPKVKDFLTNQKKSMQLCFKPSYEQQGHLTIAFNNIGSITHKFCAVNTNQSIISCDIIMFAETWLSTKHRNSDFHLDGFQKFRSDSQLVPSHRGMLMYIKDTMDIQFHKMSQTLCLEASRCCVNFSQGQFCVLGIYKPPKASYKDFLQELDELLTKEAIANSTVLLGDFNINVQEQKHKQFLDHMQRHHQLRQVVTGPSTWEGTHIDLVFTNCPQISAFVLSNTWSAHHVLFAQVPL